MLRRSLLVCVAASAAGCGGSSTGIDFNLLLDDPVRAAAASARVVISHDDGSSFPAAAPAQIKPGLVVENRDVEGNGRVDVVVTFTRSYPLVAGANHFRLVPLSLPGAINVRLRAEVFDVWDNVVARLADAQMRDWVPAVLQPGAVTGQSGGGITLHPVCPGTCSSATAYPAEQPVAVDEPVTALAAGNLTGSTQARADLAVGGDGADHAGLPATGHVKVLLAPYPYSAQATREIYGATAGDAIGSALAVGDLDGDGKDDLVIGARGAALGSGAVYVLFGASGWWTNAGAPVDLAGAKRFVSTGAGDGLGSALALLDVDGDGKPEIVAGAPGAGGGAGAVYVVYLADLVGSVPDGGAPSATAAVTGRAGAQLGRALAADRGMLAVGAPLEGKGDGSVAGAVYLLAARDLTSHHDAGSLGRWLGAGGGFGSAVALAALDGRSLSLVAGAPGAGSVLILDGASALAGDVTAPTRTVHAAAPVGSLGAAIARAPLGDVDGLVLGAPAFEQSAAAPDGGAPVDMGVAGGSRDPAAGAAFVFRGATLGLGDLAIDADGHPAAAAAYGDSVGGGFGATLAIGDFDADGVLDLAVGARSRRAIYLLLGAL